MLYTKNDSQLYIQEFKKRFTNFCEKAPLLISFTTTPTGVQVVDEATGLIFDMDFDYAIPVKSFIHGIKQRMIIEGCYPLLKQITQRQVDLSREEQIQLISEGLSLDKVPTKRTVDEVTTYLIDKVIIFKDQFVVKNLENDKMYLYKMNKSSAFFLQKIRRKKLNQYTGAEYFFANSTLLNEIEPRGAEVVETE